MVLSKFLVLHANRIIKILKLSKKNSLQNHNQFSKSQSLNKFFYVNKTLYKRILISAIYLLFTYFSYLIIQDYDNDITDLVNIISESLIIIIQYNLSTRKFKLLYLKFLIYK